MTCPNCGASDSQVLPVWEDMDRYEDAEHPDFLGCKSCSRMIRPDPFIRGSMTDVPQRRLTDREIARLHIGNQHSDDLSIIEWQVVAGAAEVYEVRDWPSKVDSTLTLEENVGLMERHGTNPTVKYAASVEKANKKRDSQIIGDE